MPGPDRDVSEELEAFRMRAVHALVTGDQREAADEYLNAHDVAVRANAWDEATALAEAVVEIATKEARRGRERRVVERAPQTADAAKLQSEWRAIERIGQMMIDYDRKQLASSGVDSGRDAGASRGPSTGPTSTSRAASPPSDLGRSA